MFTVRTGHDASRCRERGRWSVAPRCDAELPLAGAEVGTAEGSNEVSSFVVHMRPNELVSFACIEQMRGGRWAWRRARNSSCDAVGGAVGELDAAKIEASSFRVRTTHSAGRNELVSCASSERTRGARSAWQRARNSSCDSAGGAVRELELEAAQLEVPQSSSTWRSELVSFASSGQMRRGRSEWRRARNSSCDAAGGCGATLAIGSATEAGAYEACGA